LNIKFSVEFFLSFSGSTIHKLSILLAVEIEFSAGTQENQNGWTEAVERSVMDERPSQPKRGTNGGLRAVCEWSKGARPESSEVRTAGACYV
tara:strand:- start:114 stop:389 length:276 start_codon:yes stop_codon:yes gene_type:complete